MDSPTTESPLEHKSPDEFLNELLRDLKVGRAPLGYTRPTNPGRPYSQRTLIHPGHEDLSFGCEFEFVIFFGTDRDFTNSPECRPVPDWALSPEDDKHYYAPLPFMEKTHETQTRSQFAHNLVANKLLELGICVDGRARPDDTPDPFPSIYMVPDSGWDVGDDCTVCEPDKTGFMKHFEGYGWSGMEVKSPPMRACQEAFDHVRDVVMAIITNFRVRVQPTCGFHCHVGPGFRVEKDIRDNDYKYAGRPFSLRTLQRLGSLLWAADHALSFLHPPERAQSIWAPPLRRTAAISTAQNIRRTRWKPKPEKEPPAGDTQRQRLPIFRSPPNQVSDEEKGRLESANQWRYASAASNCEPPNNNALDAWLLLQGCSDPSEAIKLLVQDSILTPGRANYNFSDYFRNLRKWDDQGRRRFYLNKGTVEFREAAGSMDPEWAAVWASICCTLVSFARSAPEDVFRAVLIKLARAEASVRAGRQHYYDAIDLLRDVDARDEADFVAMRLATEESKLRHWYPCRLVYPHTPIHNLTEDELESCLYQTGRELIQDRNVIALIAKWAHPTATGYYPPFVKPGMSLAEYRQKQDQERWEASEDAKNPPRPVPFDVITRETRYTSNQAGRVMVQVQPGNKQGNKLPE
ncbi:hypothetical protein QBC47DRAFT_208111 [Echria macrotheca]|uniref:Amidoligase enzyme n=1 Tax=Echria macrotheca TaxID=438768 RepID=A0AAJ0BBN8_9PEZI|nr:hypothetical protein QBC47DRAFT_208111 [Echria macrotheca]